MSDLVRVDSTQLVSSPYSPRSFEGAWEMAQIVAKSRLAPSIQTPEAAFVVMALGSDMGMSLSQSLRGIQVIDGKACPTADCLVACVLSSGKAEYFWEVETTKEKSVWETKRKGESRPRRSVFTIEDARLAGLIRPNSGWSKFPERMLKARAKAFLVRDVYPDLALGLLTPDELEDDNVLREPIRAQVIVESAAIEPQEAVSAAPAWAHSLANAADAHALRDVANALVKEGIPMAEIKPLFDARLAEMKAAK